MALAKSLSLSDLSEIRISCAKPFSRMQDSDTVKGSQLKTLQSACVADFEVTHGVMRSLAERAENRIKGFAEIPRINTVTASMRPSSQVPIFGGSPNDTFSAFLRSFNDHANTAKPPLGDLEKRNIFLTYLTDAARDRAEDFLEQESEASFATLVNHLKVKYEDPVRAELSRQQLRTTNQLPGESVDEFAAKPDTTADDTVRELRAQVEALTMRNNQLTNSMTPRVNTVRVSKLPLFIALLACLASPTTAFNALLCLPNSPESLINFPSSFDCNSVKPSPFTQTKKVSLSVYRPNSIAYDSTATLCKIIQTTSTFSVNLFGSRYIETNSKQATVSAEECKLMMNHQRCSFGDLQPRDGIFKTNNAHRIEWPNFLIGALSPAKTVVTNNCLMLTTRIVMRFNQKFPESPAGSMRGCDYTTGFCNQRQGAAFMWKPNPEQSCRFIKLRTMSGHQSDNIWLSENKEFALSFNSSNPIIEDCGKSLVVTDQGFAVPTRRIAKREIVPPSITNLTNFVSSNQLSAQLLAAEKDILESSSLCISTSDIVPSQPTIFHNLVIGSITETISPAHYNEIWDALEGSADKLTKIVSRNAFSTSGSTKASEISEVISAYEQWLDLGHRLFQAWTAIVCTFVTLYAIFLVVAIFIKQQAEALPFSVSHRFGKKTANPPSEVIFDYSDLLPATTTIATFHSPQAFFTAQIPIKANNINLLALVDTGASFTIAGSEICALIGIHTLNKPLTNNAIGLGGNEVKIAGTAPIRYKIGSFEIQHITHFTINKCTPPGPFSYDIILELGLLIAPSVISTNHIALLVTNPSNQMVTLYPEMTIATAAMVFSEGTPGKVLTCHYSSGALPTTNETSTESFANSLATIIREAWTNAADHALKAQEKFQSSYDASARPNPIQIGDRVTMKDFSAKANLSRKLVLPWKGQFRVVEINHPKAVVCDISRPDKPNRTVHLNQIKKVYTITGPAATTSLEENPEAPDISDSTDQADNVDTDENLARTESPKLIDNSETHVPENSANAESLNRRYNLRKSLKPPSRLSF
ncbi:unnamed protein product [Caenorhabditis bovis]|uniref:Retrotransposon gag domain-containing protein n=1 Tax=Caenorhabditis bovis TaxID=2654633 RepID=A0A8S1F4V8_9PELO|nr:unnamed protein product [Caenorhabditis bovis]